MPASSSCAVMKATNSSATACRAGCLSAYCRTASWTPCSHSVTHTRYGVDASWLVHHHRRDLLVVEEVAHLAPPREEQRRHQGEQDEAGRHPVGLGERLCRVGETLDHGRVAADLVDDGRVMA